MGIQRSFRIEAKRFDITLEDGRPVQVKIKESGKRYVWSIYFSKEGARWFARSLEENITREGDPSFIRTYREHDQGFVICRQCNDYGRFVELMAYGQGGNQGRLVIPEGKKQGGWKGFLAELRPVVEPKQQSINVHGVLPTPTPRIARVDGNNHSTGGHQTWSSTLFPHMENFEHVKRKGSDTRDSCGDNDKERFGGFGARFEARVTEPVNAKNEVMLNLKVKLTCNPAGEWTATWAGLNETNPLNKTSGPVPAGPPTGLETCWA